MPQSPINTPQVTPASEWRKKKQGFVVTLPGGNVIRMRRTMDLFSLVKAGKIPNPLAGIVKSAMKQGGGAPDPEEMAKNLNEEAIVQMLELVDASIPKIVLEPRVVARPDDADFDWEPPEGAIEVTDLEVEERMFIYSVAQGGAADLESFREQQNSFMAPPSDGSDVPSAPEQPVEDQGPVDSVVSG
jgi:hypothetical protein